jgi:hypothetical protein
MLEKKIKIRVREAGRSANEALQWGLNWLDGADAVRLERLVKTATAAAEAATKAAESLGGLESALKAAEKLGDDDVLESAEVALGAARDMALDAVAISETTADAAEALARRDEPATEEEAELIWRTSQ